VGGLTAALLFNSKIFKEVLVTHIEIYTKNWCPYCHRAKALLRSQDLLFDDIDVTVDAEREREMVLRSGRYSVPQIFIGNTHIGGFDDLTALQASGELYRIIETEQRELNTVV